MKLKGLLFLLQICVCQFAGAQAFEGIIDFRKATPTDTVRYVYFIKGDNVRIEEVSSSNKVAGVMLINTKNMTAKSLNPDRKLYMELEGGSAKKPKVAGAEVVKGKATKTIAGYKCRQYVVKNPADNTSITYYVSGNNFGFFNNLLLALNRKDKYATYYQQITDLPNVFPFEAIETDLTGKKRGSLLVTSVTSKQLDGKLFEVPAGYKKFEK